MKVGPLATFSGYYC